MDIPVLKLLTKDGWTPVASSVRSLAVWREPKIGVFLRYTYRPVGDSAPVSQREGIPIFQTDNSVEKIIDSVYPVDVYIWSGGESSNVWVSPDFGPTYPVQSIVPGSNVNSNITVELTKKGMMFGVQDVFEGIATGSTVDFLIDSSPSDADYVVSYDFEFKTSQGKIIQKSYILGDYVAGTPVAIYNRNGNSLTTPKTVLTKDPTVNVVGTKVNAFLGGTETQGNSIGGGTIQGNTTDFPVEVNKSGPSLLRFIQTGGTGTFDLELKLIFAEIYL